MLRLNLERSIDLLISFFADKLERLSALQFRVICVLLVASGVAVLCCGPFQSWRRRVYIDRSEDLVELHRKYQLYRRQLAEVEKNLSDFRRSQVEIREYAEGGQLDLVHAIDRAALQSAVRVEGVQAERFGGANRQGARLRHQVLISGDFSGLSAFVADISQAHSSVVLIEVEVKSPGWSYPLQPLAAKLSIESE